MSNNHNIKKISIIFKSICLALILNTTSYAITSEEFANLPSNQIVEPIFLGMVSGNILDYYPEYFVIKTELNANSNWAGTVWIYKSEKHDKEIGKFIFNTKVELIGKAKTAAKKLAKNNKSNYYAVSNIKTNTIIQGEGLIIIEVWSDIVALNKKK